MLVVKKGIIKVAMIIKVVGTMKSVQNWCGLVF